MQTLQKFQRIMENFIKCCWSFGKIINIFWFKEWKDSEKIVGFSSSLRKFWELKNFDEILSNFEENKILKEIFWKVRKKFHETSQRFGIHLGEF